MLPSAVIIPALLTGLAGITWAYFIAMNGPVELPGWVRSTATSLRRATNVALTAPVRLSTLGTLSFDAPTEFAGSDTPTVRIAVKIGKPIDAPVAAHAHAHRRGLVPALHRQRVSVRDLIEHARLMGVQEINAGTAKVKRAVGTVVAAQPHLQFVRYPQLEATAAEANRWTLG